MKIQLFWLSGLVVAVALSAAPFATNLTAGDKDKDKDKPEAAQKTTEEAKAVQDTAAAFRMAEYGRANKSPEALLAAARVIGTTPFKKLDLKDATAEKAEAFDRFKESEKMIQEALALKTANADAVKQLADSTNKAIEASRGDPGGPRTIRGTLGRGDHKDTFHITFRGGELAVVNINNRSDRGDIDLYVFDESGRLVAMDRRSDDDASVAWNPVRTHRYRVVVHLFRGHGRPLHYNLTTN